MIGYVPLGTNDLARTTAFHDALVAEIGTLDEGANGPRGDKFYAGYFRDPDGNKLNVFCTPEPCRGSGCHRTVARS